MPACKYAFGPRIFRSGPFLYVMPQGLEATQERLLGILYRFDCPSPLTIGEYAMDLLDEAVRIDLMLHLLECVLCAAELRASDAFLGTDLRVTA